MRVKAFAPYPTRSECVPFERCHICGAILIDDEGASWPYCPNDCRVDPARVQMTEFARELVEDWP